MRRMWFGLEIDVVGLPPLLKELGPMKIKPTLIGFSGEYKTQCCAACSNKTWECSNSYHENPPNRTLNRFFEFNSVEN